ncbi:ribosomal protein L26 (apicoplast) [Plasmodium vivax]|uniref:Apicoplast ribosomal protein L6, putative n=2 Tax=Plasmodium vivax TaxID=5855 RepID=A0A565A463_PLAVI|nr:ribosomal protein L26 [Plasmodium vivax]VUZ99263.1 apicoplast ribosomal protein L6, putative [Plasmodium vivax]
MLNYKKYIFFYNNIINVKNNIYYLILDKKNFDYIYILYNIIDNKIIRYIYILNIIYIYYIYNNLFYLLLKIYKHIFFYNIIKQKNEIYKLKLNIIGINYKFYYLEKYNLIIFKLKYNHKIIIKIPKIIYCKIYINKNILCMYSGNLFILYSIGNLINSFQYINKYKELGIKIL